MSRVILKRHSQKASSFMKCRRRNRRDRDVHNLQLMKSDLESGRSNARRSVDR